MQSKIVLVFLFEIMCVENRMLPLESYNPQKNKMAGAFPQEEKSEDTEPLENVEIRVGKASEPMSEMDVYNYNAANFLLGPEDKCAILLLNDHGQSNMQQSLLRRYRYNHDGDLIPNSVRYYIKFPQAGKSSTILVPLKYKALAPSGGFVRYYKEPPRNSQSWR